MLRTSDEEFKRLVQERDELHGRVEKLDRVVRQVRRGEREDILNDELHDMEDQLSLMNLYINVLNTRITRAIRSTPKCEEE